MPGLSEILLAAGLVLGGHEMGHQIEADRLNVPASFDSNMVFNIKTDDKKKLARIAGAGLVRQDTISNVVSGIGIGGTVRIMSALNKLGYALIPASIQGGTGDVKMIEQNMGKTAREVAQGALIASAISDFTRKRGSTMGLEFGQSRRGTPMLMLRGRF